MSFKSFFFINNSIGWAGDFFVGDIAKTTDGGLTWTFQERLNFAGIRDIDFIDEKTGWVISGNSILHYNEVNTQTDRHRSVPACQNLQVFPNPFNSSTTLYYELNKSEKINIQIYDLLGRKVTALFQGKLDIGQHKTTWNAENIPSGIYFIAIQGVDFRQTIKCTVVK